MVFVDVKRHSTNISKFLLSPIILVVSVDVNLNTMFTSQIHKVLSVSEVGFFFFFFGGLPALWH